jgi:hypothetical protein
MANPQPQPFRLNNQYTQLVQLVHHELMDAMQHVFNCSGLKHSNPYRQCMPCLDHKVSGG